MTPKQPSAWWQRAWAALPFDRADVIVLCGLVLVALGCWEAWRPGAFLVPGAVLVYYGLPPRPPFVDLRHLGEQKARRR